MHYTTKLPEKYIWNVNWPKWKNICAAYVISGDYDPMYVVLSKLEESIQPEMFFDLLLAYILFYDISSACTIAEQRSNSRSNKNIWDCLRDNYHLARGSSRRYFRGDNGLNAIAVYESKHKDSKSFFFDNYKPTYSELRQHLSSLPEFGDYFMWKMMDIYDRVLCLPVSVTKDDIKYLPKAPRRGAEMVAKELGLKSNFEDIVMMMVESCQESNMLALPEADRLVGIPEIETFLCGISHHYTQRDYVGKDLDKFGKQLEGNNTKLAKLILEIAPSKLPSSWFTPPPEVIRPTKVDLFNQFG